jgi:hypothetical protein
MDRRRRYRINLEALDIEELAVHVSLKQAALGHAFGASVYTIGRVSAI